MTQWCWSQFMMTHEMCSTCSTQTQFKKMGLFRNPWWHYQRLKDLSTWLKEATTHHNGVIMSPMASQINSLTIVYLSVYSGADQRKHESSALLAFVQGIHWWPVNSPHKGPVMWKMFPFDDVIMLRNRNPTPTHACVIGLFIDCGCLDFQTAG